MADQPSANSVRTYHTTPEGFAPARNRILRQRALLFAGVVVFVVVLQCGAFADSWRSGSIISLIPVVFVIIFLLGALAVGVKIGNNRIRDSWLSYGLVIGEDFLIRRMKDHQEIEIQRGEIIAIKEADNGLRVQTKQKGREIGIPSALVGYEDAKSRLRQWGVPLSDSQHAWVQSSHWVAVFSLVGLALIGAFFLASRSWVVVVTGVPTVAVLLWSIVHIRKSANTSTSVKRLSLLNLLTLLAILVRLVLAVVNWR
jgi:hypothetical protein